MHNGTRTFNAGKRSPRRANYRNLLFPLDAMKNRPGIQSPRREAERLTTAASTGAKVRMLLSCYLCLASALFPATAATIKAVGQWSFDNPATRDHDQNQRFTVLVDGPRYLIAFESRRAFASGYVVVTSDGVDTFAVTNPLEWTPMSGLAPVRPKNSKQRFAVGAVHPSAFPQGEGMLPAQILWLGLCFPVQTEFALSDKTTLPINTVTGYKIAAPEDFRIDFVLTNSSIHRLSFYAPGRGLDRQRGADYEFPDPYTEGWLQSQLVADSFTNLGASTFPRSLVFQDFIAKKDATSRDDAKPFGTYQFTVTQLTQADEKPPFFPPLCTVGKTIVNDYRLVRADGQPHGFAVGENGNFARRDSAEFRTMQAQVRSHGRQQLTSSITFYLVVASSFVLFAWSVLRQRRNASHEKGNQ